MKKYRFSLDRKSLLLFVLGGAFIGMLVFADGVLTGMGLYRHSLLPIMLAQQRQALTASTATALAQNHAPAASAPAAANGAPAPAAAAVAAPGATATAAAPAMAAASLAQDCGIPQPAATPVDATAQPGFALQLGAFQDAANASRLVASLKGRGCTAQILQMSDSNQRVWNVVRIGPYSSLAAAAKAAADAQRTQGLLALVRPAHSI